MSSGDRSITARKFTARGLEMREGQTPSGQKVLVVSLDGATLGSAYITGTDGASGYLVTGCRKSVPTRQDAVGKLLEREIGRTRRRLRRLLEFYEGE